MEPKNTEVNHYHDIIHLPHHVSSTHPQMPILDRAAQFAPFAALSGHDAAVRETARLTDRKVELDENAKAILDEKLRILQEAPPEQQEVTVTYFLPDQKKSGGQYVSTTGAVKKIDCYTHALRMAGGEIIPIENLLNLDGELFEMCNLLF